MLMSTADVTNLMSGGDVPLDDDDDGVSMNELRDFTRIVRDDTGSNSFMEADTREHGPFDRRCSQPEWQKPGCDAPPDKIKLFTGSGKWRYVFHCQQCKSVWDEIRVEFRGLDGDPKWRVSNVATGDKPRRCGGYRHTKWTAERGDPCGKLLRVQPGMSDDADICKCKQNIATSFLSASSSPSSSSTPPISEATYDSADDEVPIDGLASHITSKYGATPENSASARPGLGIEVVAVPTSASRPTSMKRAVDAAAPPKKMARSVSFNLPEEMKARAERKSASNAPEANQRYPHRTPLPPAPPQPLPKSPPPQPRPKPKPPSPQPNPKSSHAMVGAPVQERFPRTQKVSALTKKTDCICLQFKLTTSKGRCELKTAANKPNGCKRIVDICDLSKDGLCKLCAPKTKSFCDNCVICKMCGRYMHPACARTRNGGESGYAFYANSWKPNPNFYCEDCAGA